MMVSQTKCLSQLCVCLPWICIFIFFKLCTYTYTRQQALQSMFALNIYSNPVSEIFHLCSTFYMNALFNF